MSLTLVTAPPVQPVTLAEIKAQLRVDTSDEDTLLGALIEAATGYVDGPSGILGRALVEQTWDMSVVDFPQPDAGAEMRAVLPIPLPPLREVVSVNYVDTAGATQTIASSNYRVTLGGDWGGSVEPVPGYAWPATQNRREAVTVRFRAGFAATANSPTDYRANVPRPIRQAIQLLAAHWFERRTPVVVGQTVTEVPMTVAALLAPWRVFRGEPDLRRRSGYWP